MKCGGSFNKFEEVDLIFVELCFFLCHLPMLNQLLFEQFSPTLDYQLKQNNLWRVSEKEKELNVEEMFLMILVKN